MASWIMHLVVANEIAKHFDIEKKRFNLGNLLPDACPKVRGAKDKSHFRIVKEPYETSTSEVYQYYDYDRFLNKYGGMMQDDLFLGYFCHLMTDELWIQDIYIKYMRDEHRRKRIDQKANYYHDYDVLNLYIRDRYNYHSIELADDLESENIGARVALIDEVESSELPRMLELLNDYTKVSYENEDLLLFKMNDVFNFIDNASSQIVDQIKTRHLRKVT